MSEDVGDSAALELVGETTQSRYRLLIVRSVWIRSYPGLLWVPWSLGAFASQGEDPRDWAVFAKVKSVLGWPKSKCTIQPRQPRLQPRRHWLPRKRSILTNPQEKTPFQEAETPIPSLPVLRNPTRRIQRLRKTRFALCHKLLNAVQL